MMRKGHGQPLAKGQRKAVLLRLIKMLFSFYPVMLPVTLFCILFNAIISSVPSVFMQNIIAAVEEGWQNEAGWEAYGASKGGIVSLTNSLCVSLINTGITVNAISPGWIETGDYESLTERDHKQHPSGRVGKPQDILNACLFLCREENDFINGANLIIDGGMTKKMIYEE